MLFFFKKALDSSAHNCGMVWGESGAGKVMMNQANRGLPWCQCLRLCAPTTGGPGLIPDQGTKIPHATTE